MQRTKPPCSHHYPLPAGVLPDGSIEYTCLYCGARLVSLAQLDEQRKAHAARIKDLLAQEKDA